MVARGMPPTDLLEQVLGALATTAEAFFALVHRAAAEAGRPLREITRTGHALDHPIRFAEGAYLKCVYAVAP